MENKINIKKVAELNDSLRKTFTGGCENWDNWAGGDPNNYFSADRGKEKIQQISIDANTKTKENPLFKYQRENNKNRDNPFFNS